MANWTKIEVDLGDQSGVFCPVCGAQATPTVEVDEPEMCDHIVAVYLDLIGEFMYIKPQYQNVVDALQDDEEIDDYLEGFIEKVSLPSVMFLSVTESGVTSHGMHSDTVTVGINYAPHADAGG